MPRIKENLTKVFLKQANLSFDEAELKRKVFSWWKNPREKIEGGLTLTEEGFKFLTETLDLKSYSIAFPKDFVFTTQVILWLDHFLDCPHYYTKKEIVVFKESKAVELMLFSGDIKKYGLAKAMARQRELNNIA
jgi:hypothetical protein